MKDLKPIFEATTIKILNKEYQVTCPEGQELALEQAAHLLDQKMREIRKNTRVLGLERIAIMAALNITHELLMNDQQRKDYIISVSDQIKRLQNKLNEALMEEAGS